MLQVSHYIQERKRNSVTKFEKLPNEILIECFEYLNANEIFESFDQLNYRFNKLIRNVELHLNFQYMDKTKFDKFCKTISLNPSIKNQIYSLHLSDNQTIFQIELFLSLFSLDEFIHLQSFTITKIHSDSIKKLESMLLLMPELQYLRIFVHRIVSHKHSIWEIRSNIIPMSKLQTLSLSTNFTFDDICQTSSIKNLTLASCSLKDIYKFFQYIPLLKYLNIEYFTNNNSINSETYSSSQSAIYLKQMILGYYSLTFDNFHILAKKIPNLKSLTISSYDNPRVIDAFQWEHLITSSLHQLEIFKFTFIYRHYSNKNMIIDEKFPQFQSDFWHKQHNWFTEYSYNNDSIIIYTIPYHSNKFSLIQNPCRYHNQLLNYSNTFDNVTDLELDRRILAKKCPYYFSNVTSLTLTVLEYLYRYSLAEEDIQNLQKIVNLYNVKHLDISQYNQLEDSLLLFEILQKAPNLSSLIIQTNTLKSFIEDDQLLIYLNKRIKKLVLRKKDDYRLFKNDNERKEFCQIFSNLEHLECSDCSYDDLIFMLTYLSNLSTAKVRSGAFYRIENLSSRIKNETGRQNIMVHEESEYVSFFSSVNSLGGYFTTIKIWTGKNSIEKNNDNNF